MFMRMTFLTEPHDIKPVLARVAAMMMPMWNCVGPTTAPRAYFWSYEGSRLDCPQNGGAGAGTFGKALQVFPIAAVVRLATTWRSFPFVVADLTQRATTRSLQVRALPCGGAPASDVFARMFLRYRASVVARKVLPIVLGHSRLLLWSAARTCGAVSHALTIHGIVRVPLIDAGARGRSAPLRVRAVLAPWAVTIAASPTLRELVNWLRCMATRAGLHLSCLLNLHRAKAYQAPLRMWRAA